MKWISVYLFFIAVQKEEEALRKWKEENRPGTIHMQPMRLGIVKITSSEFMEKKYTKTKLKTK